MLIDLSYAPDMPLSKRLFDSTKREL